MPCSDYDMMKVLCRIFIFLEICVPHLKLTFLLQIFYVSCYAVKLYILSEVLFLEPFDKIPFVNLSREIGRDRFPKVFLKSIIWKLKAFLRKISPKLAVHARVNMLAIFVCSISPGIVPLATPVRLFLDANNLIFLLWLEFV